MYGEQKYKDTKYFVGRQIKTSKSPDSDAFDE